MSGVASAQRRGMVFGLAFIGGFLGFTAAWGFVSTGDPQVSQKIITTCLFGLGFSLAIFAGLGLRRPEALTRYLWMPAVLLALLGAFLLVLPSFSTGLVFQRTPYGVTATLGGVFGVLAWVIARSG